VETYRDLILRHGFGFRVGPALDQALCEAAICLSRETGREELLAAVEQGRFEDERGRRVLVLPPIREVLLEAQETALQVAAAGGGIGRLARDLADRIAERVGYQRAPRRFRVILADPPWPYSKFGGEGHGAARDHYPTMSIEELKNFRVDLGWGPRRIRDLADPRGCALLMWIPATKLADGEGFEVMRAWGFTPKTKAFLWVKRTKTGKPHFGQGAYTRQSDEDCWLGKIGKITPKRQDVRREIVAPVSRHSAKPLEVYDRIESLWDGPYLELFARCRRLNWCSVGNDAAVRQTGRIDCPRA
jgi:N6-adenosine-specific RNA methylase IME4